MENLFVNIQKYVPKKDRNPKEDFFSEILAFILQNDKRLLIEFIKLIGLNLPEIKSHTIRTQVDYGVNGRPDIQVLIKDKKDNETIILIENKLDSSITEKEFEKYPNIIEKGGYLVLLTLYQEDISKKIKSSNLNKKSKDKIKHILWEKIYVMLNNHSLKSKKEKDIIVKFLINQFKGLMEDENMDPYEKITKNMLEGYNKTIDNVFKLFSIILEVLKEESIDKTKSTVSADFITRYFHFKNIKFSMDFDGENFYLYLYRYKKGKKVLTKKQEESIKRLGFEESKWHFNKSFENSSEFLKSGSEKQIEMLKKFYINNFNKIKKIIK